MLIRTNVTQLMLQYNKTFWVWFWPCIRSDVEPEASATDVTLTGLIKLTYSSCVFAAVRVPLTNRAAAFCSLRRTVSGRPYRSELHPPSGLVVVYYVRYMNMHYVHIMLKFRINFRLIGFMRCGLLRSMTPDVCQSVCLSRGFTLLSYA